MLSFEKEIKQYLDEHGIDFNDNTSSLIKLDFSFGNRKEKRYFTFDVKEKRQKYNVNNWPTNIPEQNLFILDDLAARKILAFAPNSGLVVRDKLQNRYVFFSVLDLFLMPRQRVNRKINKEVATLKGKWLIDLRNGQQCENLGKVFDAIKNYLNTRKAIFFEKIECHGNYHGEEIGSGGQVRRPKHWQTDVKQTR